MNKHIIQVNGYLRKALGDFYNPVGKVAEIVAILVISIILVKIGSFAIRKFFEKQKSFKYGIDNKKVDTVSTLMVSIFRYGVYIIATVTILNDVFHLTSVLAAAGIGGVAIGFGAQSLIKDIISGFFIILEDQFAVGDMITVDAMTGTVEQMELRVTKLRGTGGDLYIIPNGEIKKVTNHTRGNKTVQVDIPVAYSANIEKTFEIANGICTKIASEFKSLVESPKVLGITELGKDSFNLRITAIALPDEQGEVERRIRRLVKDSFSAAGLGFGNREMTVITGKEENTNG